MDELTQFRDAFKKLTGDQPFPWQEDLYMKHFAQGMFPASCNLPTGLGKTSVVAIWLIALANRPGKVPRRLVYVVNRRTVVDQTTEEVVKYRRRIAELDENDMLKRNLGAFAISTLRGQFADNREWSADPCRPAVIVGTVDMIGSRLLFSGYGIGFKGRPLQAAFLAQDTLLVHDEAHLEPAFQKLIEAIRDEQKREPDPLGARMQLRVMALSATSRAQENAFGLTNEEKEPPSNLPDPPTQPLHVVWRRLKAKKGLKPCFVKRDEVAKKIGLLARDRKLSEKAVLVFVRTIDDVKTVRRLLTDRKEGLDARQVQELTGTVRGFERDRLAKEDAVFARFLGKLPSVGRTVFLICTSAGEVGIDISADHMVCDLTPLDSMMQRLGRVNRRGESAAEIDVVCESDPHPEKKDKNMEKARWKTLEILGTLPMCDWIDGRNDASPLALRNLNLSDDERKAAFTPEPAIIGSTEIIFDSWALTTIAPPLVRTPLPGRPRVEPFLHGVSEWEPPETHVAWRDEVEMITGDLLDRYKPEELLEAYPLKPHELLRDRSGRVFDELQEIRNRTGNDTPIWIETETDQVTVTTLGKLLGGESKAVVNRIAYCRVLLSPSAGGLTERGTLDGTLAFNPEHAAGYDIADKWYADDAKQIPRRLRVRNDDPTPAPPRGMRLVRPSLDITGADEDEPSEVSGPRFWHWYELSRGADNEGSKFAVAPVRWDDHTNQVTDSVMRIAASLGLPKFLQEALKLAARFHDLGKKREVWQRSIGNPNPTDWHAKSGRDPITGKLWRPQNICPDYRHEFGSLADAESEPEFEALTGDMKDLVLHLIAAHHGRGRPHFPSDEVCDPEPKGKNMAKMATEVTRRFARLQRMYGRWGLAYLESLLRAADYAASANPKTSEGQP